MSCKWSLSYLSWRIREAYSNGATHSKLWQVRFQNSWAHKLATVKKSQYSYDNIVHTNDIDLIVKYKQNISFQ